MEICKVKIKCPKCNKITKQQTKQFYGVINPIYYVDHFSNRLWQCENCNEIFKTEEIV